MTAQTQDQAHAQYMAKVRQRMLMRSVLQYTWTYLGLFLILIFAVFPFLWTLAISLTDKNATGGVSIFDFPASLFPRQITFSNYTEVFKTFSLGKYIVNSLIITGLTVVGTLLISALAAYPLARIEFPFKAIIFGAIIGTMVLPTETNFIVNVITLQEMHLLGTHWGVVIPTIAGAFGIFLMRQAFLSIPQALIESARIDGASEMQILWKIMLPLTAPSMAALAIFTLVNTWNAYFWPSIVLSGMDNLLPLSVGVLKLKGSFNFDPFAIAAGSMIMMLPVLIIFVAAQRYFMAGNLDGAVK